MFEITLWNENKQTEASLHKVQNPAEQFLTLSI